MAKDKLQPSSRCTQSHLNHLIWLQSEQDLPFKSWRGPIVEKKTYQTLKHSMHPHLIPCSDALHSSYNHLPKISSSNLMFFQLDKIYYVNVHFLLNGQDVHAKTKLPNPRSWVTKNVVWVIRLTQIT
jgi:hypothetical protein